MTRTIRKRAGSGPVVALLCPNNDANYVGVNRAILEYATGTEWQIVPHFEALRDDRLPSWLTPGKVDGVLAYIPTAAVGRNLKKLRVPVVNIYVRDFLPGMPRFEHSTTLIADAITAYFMHAGCKHLAWCGSPDLELSPGLAAAFEAACKAREIKPLLFSPKGGSDELSRNGYEYAARSLSLFAGDRALKKWLRSLPMPSAVVACNDGLGVTLINLCQKSGIRVPEDLAIMGMGNLANLCLTTRPALSSLCFNAAEIGYQSCRLLSEMLARKSVPLVNVIMPDAVVERDSTRTLFAADPLVRKALKRMDAELAGGVNIKVLCEELGCGRSKFERAFIRELGRTPGQELLLRRLSHAEQLLEDTDLTVSEIARQCAYNDASYFCTVFKRHHRMTPGAYRACKTTGAANPL